MAGALLESDAFAALDDVTNLVPVELIGADEETVTATHRDRLQPLRA